MNILSIEHGVVPEVTETGGVVSMTDRFARAYAEALLGAGADLKAIQQAANDPRTASDPELMFRLQVAQEDYGKRMTVTAGLVNHCVKGVETVVKS